MPSALADTSHVVVDMTNRLVTPGFVNTHHHMFQCLTKSVATDCKLFEWLTTLLPIWKHLTSDMVYKAAKFAIAELLLSGCTLSTDLHYLYHNGVTLDDTIRAARELGIRFQPCRGAITIGQSKGGLPEDRFCEEEEDVLQDMQRLIEQYHDPSPGSMLRIVLAPCSPFTVSLEMMKNAARLARQYPKVMLHSHLAENSSDIEHMQKNLQQTLTAFLDACEWNKKDCWFAHCVKLSEHDAEPTELSSLDYFAEMGLGVAHCPVSNCRLASGIAPVRKMLERGIKVGLGVDGSASNDSGNILAETRMAFMLARVKDEDPAALSTVDALRMATSGGASVLGRPEVGTLSEGMCADMVGWRLDAPAFAGALYSKQAVLSALVLGSGGDLRADYVMVHGKTVVKDGMLTEGNDMATITKELNAASYELFDLAGELQKDFQTTDASPSKS